MSSNKKNRELPRDIFWQVAAKAYEQNQRYYGDAEMLMEPFEKAPRHVQKSVIRDVKAIVVGNRDAEYLHEAWRDRKLEATHGRGADWQEADLDKFQKAGCETAWSCWELLDSIDKGGYISFVNFVKREYAQLTDEFAITVKEPLFSTGTKALDLVLATTRHTQISYYERRGKWTVQVHFDNQEDAEAFKKAVVSVKQ